MVQSIPHILIGLDGSSYSEAAVELGIRWAREGHAVLVGLGVVDEPTICKPEPTGVWGNSFKQQRDEALLRDARARVAGFLERFTQRCAAAQLPCQALQEVGLPSERLLSEAEDHDLTLVGQRSYFHFATQTRPDETLGVVLRQCRRPVVAVPTKLPESRTAVVAFDGRPASSRALEAFRKAVPEHWETVRVVSVDRRPEVARRHAEEGARFLRFYDIPAEARPLPASRPTAELLLDQVRDLGAGMLVLGAFEQRDRGKSLSGATTRAVLEKVNALLFLHH
jgi:nucleotide-binding universal stress UspA family protein